MTIVPWSTAVSIDAAQRRVGVRDRDGRLSELAFDELVVATGADSLRPPIAGVSGPDARGPDRGVFLIHSIGDARALMDLTSAPDDHKRYYPGASPSTIRVTGDVDSGQLLDAQLVGRLGAEVSKRVDIYAAALYHGMRVKEINLHHHAAGRVHVLSAGSAPADSIDPEVLAAMAEAGVDMARESPKPLTDEIVQASDIVVTMGCGDACPVYPGKRYLDWEIDDPEGKTADQVRAIRDEIERRVSALLSQLVPSA